MTLKEILDALGANVASALGALDSRLSEHATRLDGHATRLKNLESEMAEAIARIKVLEAAPVPKPEPDPLPPPPPPPPPYTLTKKTATVYSTRDGEAIENMQVDVATGDGIVITHNNVTVRNVRVKHRTRHGIHVTGDDVKIQKFEIINADPPSGLRPESDENKRNINLDGAARASIEEGVCIGGSSNIYVHKSPGTVIRNVEGYNPRGPMPKGQFVQFDKSPDCTLDTFYAYADPSDSYPEDNVNVGSSPRCTIKNGLIVGNNSVTGVGVLFEYNSEDSRAIDVDAVKMGNGAFSSWSDGWIEFTRCRAFDSVHRDQGRGMNSSNTLNFCAAGEAGFYDCAVVRPGNAGNILWPAENADPKEIRRDDTLQPKAKPTSINLPWDV